MGRKFYLTAKQFEPLSNQHIALNKTVSGALGYYKEIPGVLAIIGAFNCIQGDQIEESFESCEWVA